MMARQIVRLLHHKHAATADCADDESPWPLLAQFFTYSFDKYHIFLGRLLGAIILGQSYLAYKAPADVVFPIAVATQIAVAILGPFKAHMTLEKKMPILLMPVLMQPALLGLALLGK